MRRPALAALVAASSLALLAPSVGSLSATAAPGAPGAPGAQAQRRAAEADVGGVRNILPPGSNGNATALELLALGGTTADESTPTNFADQLEVYDALTTAEPDALTDPDLDRFFKDASFIPQEVVSTESPREGVVIERDQWGVPFITGETFKDVEYGAGYAAVQDRMFLMDVLRHTGAARMTEFVGDTPGNVAMDQAQLRSAFYTREEAAAQIDVAAERAEAAGANAERLEAGVDAFIEGINDAQADLCPVVVAPTCPAEYAVLQKQPRDWDRADVVYVASLVGGIFGKGGGGEAANADWYQRLVEALGAARGTAAYRDLREKEDREAPVTTTVAAPYGSEAFRPGKPGVALPDLDGPSGGGTGEPVGATVSRAASPGEVEPLLELPGGIEVPLEPRGMSNALLVTGEESATGKPLAVMGPQTGYYAPQLLVEQVLMGPGIRARGVAFAGTNLFVQLGRGTDYAWSATSASSDNIDTVVERLCNVDGSEPSVESTAYRVGERCVEMEQFVHTQTTTPNATAPSPPTTYEFQVLRTRHGIVQERTTVDGEPVAVVKQRSTYGREVDSVIGFSQLNDPGFVRDARTFQRAAGNIDFTFNWFYADDRDIAYFSSGLLPQRARGVEPDLPRWGERKYDWKGWLPFAGHPREIDPDRGYLVSWNNKPAPGFTAADDNWSYGSVYRSSALEDRVRAATRGTRRVDLPAVVGIMSEAATADSRAAATLPELLAVLGRDLEGDEQARRAVVLLRAWLADGAPRVDRDRDGAYTHEQAIALFDTWWQDGQESVARDVLRGRLGDLVAALPQGLDDHPRHGIGSAWNGIAWYGYVDKELRSVLGRRIQDPYRLTYCGDGRLQACRTDLVASFRDAVARALAAQDVASVEELTYDKTQDQIRAVTGGAVGVRPIDWQNRPTFQQVVAFEGDRPR